MFKNKSVDIHSFSMVPKFDVPRSSFNRQWAHKTTFNVADLIPVYVDEVLPADSFNLSMTAFARLATPIFPIMDNLIMESFFFFVPARLVWDNFRKFMGEQANPADSISFLIPQHVSPVGGYAVGSLQDYMGLPTVGAVGLSANTVSTNALPLRAYNLIYNEWFRDENLQNSVIVDRGDGPDASPATNYKVLQRGKRHDYFTSALPWPQKGGTAVSLPLGISAPIKTSVADQVTGVQTAMRLRTTAGALPATGVAAAFDGTGQFIASGTVAPGVGLAQYPSNLFADLSAATAATVSQLRQSFQIQKLLERDARGGTRYTELIRSHFGVNSPDARLQRPEFLGGGQSLVNIHPIAQQSATGVTGGTAPLGTLSAMGTLAATNHGFRSSFVEHGYVIGLVNVRADISYQQGIRKMWSRSTRYDFYWPEFAMLGEQAVLNKEIFADGSANDLLAFGYQERWAEYRYFPSQITGLFKSTSAGTLDGWHLAQKFASLPTLNSTFITDAPPMSRVKAVTSQPDFIFDSVFHCNTVRAMPLYSVPGLIDHF